jgi:hypothetical protein
MQRWRVESGEDLAPIRGQLALGGYGKLAIAIVCKTDVRRKVGQSLGARVVAQSARATRLFPASLSGFKDFHPFDHFRLSSIPITMLSLRYLARSVPRATSTFAARIAYRQTLPSHTLRFSPVSSLSRSAPRLAAAFSMSSSRSQGISGHLVSFVHRSNRFADEVLAEKLNNEITYEKNFSQSEKSNRAAQRANIDSFLQQQGFEVHWPSLRYDYPMVLIVANFGFAAPRFSRFEGGSAREEEWRRDVRYLQADGTIG